MKYYFRRIICGVAIGLILFYCKSCEVHAGSVYLYNLGSSSSLTMSFDVCKKFDTNYMCVNGFNKSTTLNRSSTYNIIHRNSTDTLALKSFSMYLTGFDTFQIMRYGSLNSSPSFFHNIFGYNNTSDFRPFRYNGFLSYVKITTTDNTVCEIDTNLGATFQNTSSEYPDIFPYFEVPSSCRGKYLKNIEMVFQSGYNYNGDDIPFTTAKRTDFQDFDSFLSRNKTNTYLALFDKRNITLQPYVGNIQLYFGSSSYGTTTKNQDYTLTSQEIQQNLSELEKQVILAELGGGGSSDNTGPDEPSSENTQQVKDTIDDVSNVIAGSVSSAGFNDFLTALTQKPIVELQYVANNLDNPGVYCPNIYIPFMVNRDNNTTRFGTNLPCMSTIYSTIPYVGGNANNWGFSIISLWHIILHGYLMYLLVLTWLNIVKYTISRNSSEIEVIEL